MPGALMLQHQQSSWLLVAALGLCAALAAAGCGHRASGALRFAAEGDTDASAASDAMQRDATSDSCVADTTDFDQLAYFPASVNTCTAYALPLRLDGMTFRSIGGDGTVWECGPNLLYTLTSRHIALEAGARLPAEIAFDTAITSLRFDYAARLGPLNVELLGDDKVLTSLWQVNNAKASVALDFKTPVVSIRIRSKTGVTSQIALDNIQYQSAACKPPVRGRS